MSTNLGVEFIDTLNGKLQVTGVNGVTNVYSFLNGFTISRRNNAGFFGKVHCGVRITFIDQIVHDKEIQVSVDVCQSSMFC
jgi:hypothetical protein